MKRLFILASAAIVALAACTKTEVVYTEAPAEIGFKTINLPMTKAVAYTADLGIAAFNHGTDDLYFDVAPFEEDGGVWKGAKYWPLEGKLDFVAYGPYTGGAASVEVANDHITATNVASDVDFVYTELLDNSGAGFEKPDDANQTVPVVLKHTKAKVVVNVTPGSNEEITKIEVLDAADGGNCTMTFGIDPVWTGTTTKDFDFTTVNTHYVVPCAPTTIKITYNSKEPAVNGLEVNVTLADQTMYDSEDAVVAVPKWTEGTAYTYDITITSGEILVDAKTDDWVEIDNSNI